MATASKDGTAQVVETDSPWRRRFLLVPGQRPALAAVAFSPDGKHLVTPTLSGVALVWSLKSGTEVLTLHGRPLTSVAFPMAPDDGSRVAIAAGPVVRIFQLNPEQLKNNALALISESKFELNASECRQYLRQDKCSAIPSPAFFRIGCRTD
jgi:WD40 repeat protein